jgi:RND family efflux transporter MFP subunit
MNAPGDRNDPSRPPQLGEMLDALRLPDAPPERARSILRSRWLWLAAGVLLLGLAFVALRPETALEVQIANAEPFAEAARQPIPVLSGTGYLVPAQPIVAVGSRVAGRIARYLVDEGDTVSENQALVELDARPFEATASQARAGLAAARARLTLAQSELRRVRELFRASVASQEALDRAESEASSARAAVAELEATLERAETDLADTVIRAPTSGVVLETLKQPGEIAVPGGFAGSGDLLRLANLQEIRAELDVNESDLAHVFLGQKAQVVPDAYPDATWDGEVVELSPQIDRQKGTRQVEVRVLSADPRLLPDMSARVVFLAALDAAARGSNGASVVIPRSALRRDADGRFFAWVAADGRSRRVPVEAGESLGDRVVIRSGLEGGAQVILGTAPEREGQRVRTSASD